MSYEPTVPTDQVVHDILRHLDAVGGLRVVLRPPLLPGELQTAKRALLGADTPDVSRIVDELRANGLLDLLHVSESQINQLLAKLPTTITLYSLDQALLDRLVHEALAALTLLAPDGSLPTSALLDEVLAGSVGGPPTFNGNGAAEEWSRSALALALLLAIVGGTAASFDNQVTDALQNAANLFGVILLIQQCTRPRNGHHEPPPDGPSDNEPE